MQHIFTGHIEKAHKISVKMSEATLRKQFDVTIYHASVILSHARLP